MSILGTFVDKNALVSLGGVTTTTLSHSLATTPDLVLTQLRSVAASSSNAALYAIGGNASLVTVGLAGASANTGAAQVAAFDVFSIYFWSAIR